MPKEKILYPEEYPPIPLPEVGGEGGVGKTGNMSPGGVLSPPQIPDQPMQIPNVSYELINATLNTQTQQILGTYTFGQLGAIRIGNYVSGTSGDINISPDGIVGRNSAGTTTFSISGTTGSATFLGEVLAGSVISTSISANQITGQIVNAQIATIEWAKITSVSVTNADIVSINATKITAGDIATARMSANVLDALQINVTELSAITADIGTITAGTIDGVIITGGTVRTSSSGQRVELTTNDDIRLYNPTGTLRGQLYADSSKVTLVSSGETLLLEAGTEDLQFKTGNGVFNFLFGVNVVDWLMGTKLTMNSLDILNGGDGYVDMDSGNGNTQVEHLDPKTTSLYNCGGSSRYWQYVNCVDIGKFEGGSFGVFDDGVELQDGRIVSDTEALLAMQPDPTKKTYYGKPAYDINTIPKQVRITPTQTNKGEPVVKMPDGRFIAKVKRKKRDVMGREILDEKGKPIFEEIEEEHKEGERVFVMMSIMIGAIKELALRIEALEGV